MRTDGAARIPVRTVDVRARDARFHTRAGWLDSRHSFSFGPHYAADNTHFGVLLVSNDDRVAAGTGFSTHPHRDMEIVTWVVTGELVHQDSAGHNGLITPGLAQRMSAGSGILHSELNSAADPVHFIQMWVLPDDTGAAPSYAQRDVAAALQGGALVPIASGSAADAAIPIRQRGATLYAARLPAGGQVTLPDVPFVHLFVAAGGLQLEDAGPLVAGDAARLTAAGPRRVRATTDSEVLVWAMTTTAGG